MTLEKYSTETARSEKKSKQIQSKHKKTKEKVKNYYDV